MGNVRSEALGDDGCLDIHLPSCYDKRKSFLEASTSVVGARNVGGNESRTNMFIIMIVVAYNYKGLCNPFALTAYTALTALRAKKLRSRAVNCPKVIMSCNDPI